MTEPPSHLPHLPLVVEPDLLERHLGHPSLVVVDLGKADTYARGHVPGALFLDYGRLILGRPPAPGLVPPRAQLETEFSGLGIGPDSHVVACDDEGGGKAARLLWTLELLGHRRYSLLNGGLHAWASEGHPLEAVPARPRPRPFTAVWNPAPLADRDYVLAHLGDPQVALLDTRSPEEFTGRRCFATRCGHIPGAVNMDWTLAMDRGRNLRLLPEDELRALFLDRDVTPDREVIVYCQTHHRSSHTWLVLRHLGYEQVRGYAGAWAEWGNDPETPIET